ncbi:Ig-like domain-containing protein, partial [Bisbaumannia pacifica]
TDDTSLAIDILDDGPQANDDSANVAEDSATLIDVFANDVAGADGVDLVNGVTVASGPSQGSLVYNDDGTFT